MILSPDSLAEDVMALNNLLPFHRAYPRLAPRTDAACTDFFKRASGRHIHFHPAGNPAFQKKSYAETVLQITGIIQTIPSLAILGLMIPFLGIGTLPALTALIIYALFPICRIRSPACRKFLPY